jgi:hypothetical protein
MLAQFGNSGYSRAIQLSAYWNAMLVDREDFLERILEFLKESQVWLCNPSSGSNGTMIAVTPLWPKINSASNPW